VAMLTITKPTTYMLNDESINLFPMLIMLEA